MSCPDIYPFYSRTGLQPPGLPAASSSLYTDPSKPGFPWQQIPARDPLSCLGLEGPSALLTYCPTRDPSPRLVFL